MARRSAASGEHATSVIRLFPGWADSVLWFPSPVPYADTHLDAALQTDLRAWERSYYAGLDAHLAWPSRQLEADFRDAGARLARRLADQVGDEFQVEFDTETGLRRVRGSGPARNPEAAAAFRRLAEDSRREWADLRTIVDRAKRDGHTLEWRAYPEER